MGFRQLSHFFTDIHLALQNGEIDEAPHIWPNGVAKVVTGFLAAKLPA